MDATTTSRRPGLLEAARLAKRYGTALFDGDGGGGYRAEFKAAVVADLLGCEVEIGRYARLAGLPLEELRAWVRELDDNDNNPALEATMELIKPDEAEAAPIKDNTDDNCPDNDAPAAWPFSVPAPPEPWKIPWGERERYASSTKVQALAAVEHGASIEDVADVLGAHASTVYGWVKAAKAEQEAKPAAGVVARAYHESQLADLRAQLEAWDAWALGLSCLPAEVAASYTSEQIRVLLFKRLHEAGDLDLISAKESYRAELETRAGEIGQLQIAHEATLADLQEARRLRRERADLLARIEEFEAQDKNCASTEDYRLLAQRCNSQVSRIVSLEHERDEAVAFAELLRRQLEQSNKAREREAVGCCGASPAPPQRNLLEIEAETKRLREALKAVCCVVAESA